LIAAIDAAGNAAVYSYDAVGNILSIQRFSSTDVSIIGFTPTQGQSGTSVIITGTGFSATASQNLVQFNGTNATVISSTTNQIVATVPAGAATGTITVTSPLGSATSTDSFTVAVQTGAPQITSFSPQIVAPGAAVSVGGANFDSVPANNRLKLNATAASTPTAVTSSSMTMTTPAATGSGRISLSTPAGLTSTSNDLFVPPSGFTVSQVAYTGRTNLGTATTVSIPTGNKIGLLLFEGNAGQSLSIVTSSPTFSACSFQLYKPDNTAFGSAGNCTFSLLLGPQVLPVSGTYTVLINDNGSSGGSVAMTLYEFSGDVTGSVAVGGSTVTVQNTIPGQNMQLTFAGTQNQHVSVSITSSTLTTCNMSIYQPNPDLLPNSLGPLLAGPTDCSHFASFFDVPILPVTGMYTLLLDPAQAQLGSVTLKINNAPDVTGTITIGGPSVTSTTTVPGQNIRLTFSGTAGQLVSGVFDNDSFPGQNVSISLLSPTGTAVKSISTTFANGSGFLDPANYCGNYPCSVTTLPSTGTYTLFFDPSGADIGSIRATLYSVPSDQAASVNLGDPPVAVNLNTPGQNSRITFTGAQNHKLSIKMTGGTFSGTVNPVCRIDTVAPGGSVVGGIQNCYTASGFFDIGALPANGTYTVVTDPGGNTIGGASLQLYDDTDITLAIAADGTSHTVTTTVPGQNVSLNFSGTAGQRIFGVVNNISGYTGLNFLFAQLLRGTSNQTITYSVQDGSTFIICSSGPCDSQILPATDFYSVFLNPNGTDVGSATVTLYTVPADFSSSIDTAGTPVTVTTTTPGQNAQLTFSATTGQSLSFSLAGGTYPAAHCLLNLKRPDGVLVTSGQDCSGASHSFGPFSLTVSGTYTMTIDPQYAAIGNVTVAVTAH
jgi:hypothetical protein